MSLAAGKTTRVQVPLTVPWSNVLALVQLGAINRPVPYTVEGTVRMGGSLVNVAIPFHLDGTVTHDQIVSATMRSIPAFPGMPH